jgi:hypothetical protein
MHIDQGFPDFVEATEAPLAEEWRRSLTRPHPRSVRETQEA